MYTTQLQRAPNPHHKVTGGFHLNPKGIELALRVCTSYVYGVTLVNVQTLWGEPEWMEVVMLAHVMNTNAYGHMNMYVEYPAIVEYLYVMCSLR